LVLETQLVLNLLQDFGDIVFNLLVEFQSVVKINVFTVAVRTVFLMKHHIEATTDALKDVYIIVFVLFLNVVKICKDLRLSFDGERN
jgi:hypothetical protein